MIYFIDIITQTLFSFTELYYVLFHFQNLWHQQMKLKNLSKESFCARTLQLAYYNAQQYKNARGGWMGFLPKERSS